MLGPILIALAAAFSGRSEYGIALLVIPFVAGGLLLSRVKFPEESQGGA